MGINKLIEIAIKASISAGEKILKVYKSGDFKISSKSDNTPLTIADQNAHDEIMKFLDKTGIPVLSEEGLHLSYSERKKWTTFWLVDPLDGTKEFIKRNGEFTVNIALLENNIPVAGIIYVPVTKVLYFSTKDAEAYKIKDIDFKDINRYDFEILIANAIKLPVPNFERPFTVVGSRSHLSQETTNFIEDLKVEHGEIEILSVGSSLKQCMIAEGRADIYPRFGPTMEWDTGAGHALINAVGGSITQIDGKPLLYNKENLMNPHFIVKSYSLNK